MNFEDNIQEIKDIYTKWLKTYLLNNDEEEALISVYNDLFIKNHFIIDDIMDIFDIHILALKQILKINNDNDKIDWIYIKRANEFFAQFLTLFENYRQVLREQVEIDPLTRAYNRLSLDNVGEKVFNYSLKNKSSLLCVMLDLDNFKHINDAYGHDIGDQVLINVSKILKKNIKQKDFLYRYGGEEFLILLRDINYDEAFPFLTKLKDNLKKIKIKSLDKKITASFGATSLLEDNPISLYEMIKYADTAMYKAKKTSKDKVVFFRDLK
ncbi:diguanylate cyclase (GGDEF)-like protein [Hypnocyclicus thermotrophus]|uniref:Diguanylate cyclase (GGDEF)-like protein n=1 Tax=Hypnocyclicus thermotrophus TaxID=1627895 RepID=A0AA46E070_9FUSO|nr:GGDEF domain-containing protein [Hypnocyclicus thermotrophus]TDT72346.1 diguanylate cyclase (GGDEF)-like protein [Hypnocyclicus thermotrophus]